MPELEGSSVLVTGANGGLGEQFVRQALDRGAVKVYATARSPRDWQDPRVVPLALDVTDDASIAAAVQAAPDVTVLVNNAGATPPTASLLEVTPADLRANTAVNFLGPVLLAKAFAPQLIGAREAALIDVHSIASWYAFAGAYSASKAALWSATNSLRLELDPRGVHVVGLYMGYVDTAMAAGADGPKLDPARVVGAVWDAVRDGEYEVLADEGTAGVRAALGGPLTDLYPSLRRPER